MSTLAVLHLRPIQEVNVQRLVSALSSQLNRSPEPPVLVTLADGVVCFQAETWQPILLARVEDALDEVIGTPWRCGLTWTYPDAAVHC